MNKTALIILIITCIMVVSIVYSKTVTREALYRKFGPLIVEAVVLVLKDEINIIRKELELPKRTKKELYESLDARLEGLEKYEWMN